MKKLLCLFLMLLSFTCIVMTGCSDKMTISTDELIEQYVKSLVKLDGQRLYLMPDELADLVAEVEHYDSIEELLNDGMAYYDETLITYKYKSHEIVSEYDYSSEEIKDIITEYEGREVILDIEEAKDIEVYITVSDGDNIETCTVNVNIIKIDGDWYVNSNSIFENSEYGTTFFYDLNGVY